ncbi:hypothetical protein WR25_24341 isoform B [Diploscapter pachys]|uniref:BZIP domain-containing protein n=1 Tax=Diploscapter pachys TaxID=2018661 RepID=A0A2A2KBV4_9BILA|nr:hypothetical protein WR25_24341 isoform B [Diploscapter pachys]
MVRSVYSRSSMSPRTDDEPEMSRKEKNRLAAARFRNKQKSEIQLFRELCENQTNEITTLKNRLKIATERCGELSRLLDIAVTYYGEPPELKGRMLSRTPVVSIANHQKSPDFSQSYSGYSSTSSSEWSPNCRESTPSIVSSPDLDFSEYAVSKGLLATRLLVICIYRRICF